MSSSPSVFCFEILADADPVVLIRLVERIQSLGLIPQRLEATWAEDRVIIQLLCCGLDEAAAGTLARRIGQFTTVHSVDWSDLRADLDRCALCDLQLSIHQCM
jgi:hypothetical protein